MFKKEKHKVSVILHSNVINVQGICTKDTVKYCKSQDKIVILLSSFTFGMDKFLVIGNL